MCHAVAGNPVVHPEVGPLGRSGPGSGSPSHRLPLSVDKRDTSALVAVQGVPGPFAETFDYGYINILTLKILFL